MKKSIDKELIQLANTVDILILLMKSLTKRVEKVEMDIEIISEDMVEDELKISGSNRIL